MKYPSIEEYLFFLYINKDVLLSDLAAYTQYSSKSKDDSFNYVLDMLANLQKEELVKITVPHTGGAELISVRLTRKGKKVAVAAADAKSSKLVEQWWQGYSQPQGA